MPPSIEYFIVGIPKVYMSLSLVHNCIRTFMSFVGSTSHIFHFDSLHFTTRTIEIEMN
jgi:hypothetical protein